MKLATLLMLVGAAHPAQDTQTPTLTVTEKAGGQVKVQLEPAQSGSYLLTLQEVFQAPLGRKLVSRVRAGGRTHSAEAKKGVAEWSIRLRRKGWYRITVRAVGDTKSPGMTIDHHHGNPVARLSNLSTAAGNFDKWVRECRAYLAKMKHGLSAKGKKQLYAQFAKFQQKIYSDSRTGDGLPASRQKMDLLVSDVMLILRGDKAPSTAPPGKKKDRPAPMPTDVYTNELDNLTALSRKEEALTYVRVLLVLADRSATKGLKTVKNVWAKADRARKLQEAVFGGGDTKVADVISQLMEGSADVRPLLEKLEKAARK